MYQNGDLVDVRRLSSFEHSTNQNAMSATPGYQNSMTRTTPLRTEAKPTRVEQLERVDERYARYLEELEKQIQAEYCKEEERSRGGFGSRSAYHSAGRSAEAFGHDSVPLRDCSNLPTNLSVEGFARIA